MYTGIIDHQGEVTHIEQTEQGLYLTIACQFKDIALGESIALDGVCVTAIKPNEVAFSAEISPETLKLTTLGQLKKGDNVNLERSLTLSDRLGGHIVLGHVDETVTLTRLEKQGEFTLLVFSGMSEANKRYLSKKGSITINGISLTINELTKNDFHVMIIPHTLERTNLGRLAIGDYVNIEYDHLMKVIIEQIDQRMSLLPK